MDVVGTVEDADSETGKGMNAGEGVDPDGADSNADVEVIIGACIWSAWKRCW